MKPLHMIETRGTRHATANDFADAFASAAPGIAITYAIGDVGYSAPYSPELTQLKKLVWERYQAGLCCLTQKADPDPDARFELPGGGRGFHYIATKRDPRKGRDKA